MRYHPNHQMDLPISNDVYQQLLLAAGATGYQKEFWEIGESAIRDWMVRHHPDVFSDPIAGYQWKHVFLPHGTLLRTIIYGRNHHCVVEDDCIRYKGAEVSPSVFVNTVGGVRRSAWKSLWILFPNKTDWVSAQSLRQMRQ